MIVIGHASAQSQVGFFKFACIPLYSIMADLVDPLMQPWLNMQENLKYWEGLHHRWK